MKVAVIVESFRMSGIGQAALLLINFGRDAFFAEYIDRIANER